MSEHRRAYRRVTKALRLAQSSEADSIVAAAKEILATRIKHGDALNSPTAAITCGCSCTAGSMPLRLFCS